MSYDTPLLDELRTFGDPALDPIVATLAHNGELQSAKELLAQLQANGQDIPAELPDTLEIWLKAHQTLPGWVDHARLDRASRFFVKHGMPITLLLVTSGLVGCYAAQKGVKVLTFTYRLQQTPYHRIAETGQYVLHALAPGGLLNTGKGLMATLKVRLIHATIRHLILESGKWDTASLGVPICQEDLLGTLMVFSYGTLWGLEQLGIAITDQEKEDYLYTWQIIGELLGIDPKVIPTSIEEAAACGHAIAARQHGPSPEGIALTKALLEMHYALIPGDLFDGVIPALIRRTVGNDMADSLEIPRTSWDVIVQHSRTATKWLDKVDSASGIVGEIVDQMGIALMQREAIRVTGYDYVAYRVPESLQSAWHLETRKEERSV